MKKELERIEIPDEHEARVRAWRLMEAAFAEREPAARRRSWRPLAVALAAIAVLAAALSPPGRAVLGEVREVVGVEGAEPALFSLPTSGRLLVTSDAGAWVVAADGSKRLLEGYRDASWSPFGRFIVVARANELAALEPDGDVRWKLARRDVRLPEWGGTRADTRIAYISGSELRVVAGDGTGDRRLARRASRVAPAWRPGAAHVLAYARRDGFVRVVDAENGSVLSKRAADATIALDWVADRRLVVTTNGVRLFDDSGGLRFRRGGRIVTAALSPRAQALAMVRLEGGTSVVEVVARGGRVRRVFAGTGRFEDVAWSPDGRWLLVSWPEADQWVFVRADGRRRIETVANVTEQLESRGFPRVEGWCCAP